MFFVLSKTFWFFVQPSSLIMALLVIGIVLSGRERFRRLGQRLSWCAIILFFACGLGPVGNLLILPLEQRFPAPHGKLPVGPVSGIIVLGGYEDGRITSGRGTLTLNEAAERITETAWLAHKLPKLPVVISGGAVKIVRDDQPAAVEIAAYLRDIGVAGDRILIEDRSLTTYENAKFTREVVKLQPGQRWILVTSAAHMPRSVATFRHQGFDVIAWPADFRTKDASDLLRPFEGVPRGLRRMDEAAMEWVGLLAYRILGRSSDLFPEP